MPEIICDWMLCKYNTSQKVGQLGRCIKEDGVVKLESKVVTGIEGMEVLRLLCNAYFEDEKKSTKIDEEYRRNQEVLQYYIVNTDLNMSVGKIAVSVGHINTLTTIDIPSNWREREDLVYSEWVDNGMKKIVLKANTKTIEKLLNKFPYDFYSVRDNGLTEVPKGSITAIGLKPMKREQAKMFVKGLRLL